MEAEPVSYQNVAGHFDMDYQLSFAKTNDLSDHCFHTLLI